MLHTCLHLRHGALHCALMNNWHTSCHAGRRPLCMWVPPSQLVRCPCSCLNRIPDPLALYGWQVTRALEVPVIEAQAALTMWYYSGSVCECFIIECRVNFYPLEALQSCRSMTVTPVVHDSCSPLKAPACLNDCCLVCHKVPSVLGYLVDSAATSEL